MWVLYGHITKETTICPQDVIFMGLHLPPRALNMLHFLLYRNHGSHCKRKWSKMSSRPAVVNASTIYSSLQPPLWILHVDVQFPCHHQFGSPGALLEHCDGTLYPQGVVGGKVISDDVTSPLPCRQMEADGVGPGFKLFIMLAGEWRKISKCG